MTNVRLSLFDAHTALRRSGYEYDPYGRLTKVSGDLESDFGFTGSYRHQSSVLCLALYRAYDPVLARWLSRDPIGESAGTNVYAYVSNNPLNLIDLLGLSDLNLMSPTDSSYASAQFVPTGRAIFTMTFHGSNSGGFYRDAAGTQPLSRTMITDAILNSGIQPGQTIEADVCWGGTGWNLRDMKRISKDTSHPIIAATGFVGPRALNGKFYDMDVSGGRKGTGWVLITPDGKVVPYSPSYRPKANNLPFARQPPFL